MKKVCQQLNILCDLYDDAQENAAMEGYLMEQKELNQQVESTKIHLTLNMDIFTTKQQIWP